MTSKQCQAVVVIHGIGKQRPMDTLRGFVDSVLDVVPGAETGSTGRPAYYSKPDSFSNSFELRRLCTRESRPRTEFFELYWAHRMPLASWQRILEWARLLLQRPVSEVPRCFRVIWWALWITVVAIWRSFNVAAADQPRKGASRRRQSLWASSFNVAAADQPRKVGS